MTNSDPKNEKANQVSRRNMLKWTGALAAVGVVGIGLGIGGELLIRPNNTTTRLMSAH
ncbi:MAG: twin-arginine translocation signal domain-containing protein [Candidatus Micrarchaeaceae archaeon]